MDFILNMSYKLLQLINYILDLQIGDFTVWNYLMGLLIPVLVFDFIKLFAGIIGRRNKLKENIEYNYRIKKELEQNDNNFWWDGKDSKTNMSEEEINELKKELYEVSGF